MSSFKMRNRPKKPSGPRHVDTRVGNYVSLSYLLETIEKFKIYNPEVDPRDIMLEAQNDWYEGGSIYLTAPPQPREVYEEELQEYKIEYKSYQAWQVKYKKEIAKHNAAKKKATTKTKLKRTQTRLNKELMVVQAKLERV